MKNYFVNIATILLLSITSVALADSTVYPGEPMKPPKPINGPAKSCAKLINTCLTAGYTLSGPPGKNLEADCVNKMLGTPPSIPRDIGMLGPNDIDDCKAASPAPAATTTTTTTTTTPAAGAAHAVNPDPGG